MGFKRQLIREFLKIVDKNELKDLAKKEIIIKFSNGTEVKMLISVKDNQARLKLVKHG